MEIIATKREKLGKQNKSLRRNRQIPAVIYGVGMESTNLTIDLNSFIKLYKEAGETTLVEVKYNDSSEKVLIKEVQLHPVNLNPIHVSFHKVDLTATIRASIPVEIVGEEDNELVQKGEGMVLALLSEIEVEALPANLPPSFEVSVSHLKEIGDAVTVAELKFDKELVEIVGSEPEDLIVKIDYAEMAEEEEEELTEEELIEGMEVTGEKEVEEGEEGEEGTEEKKEEKAPEPKEEESK